MIANADELLCVLSDEVRDASHQFLHNWLYEFERECISHDSKSCYLMIHDPEELFGTNYPTPLNDNRPCFGCFHGDLTLSLLMHSTLIDKKELRQAVKIYESMGIKDRERTLDFNYLLLDSMGIKRNVASHEFSETVQQQIDAYLEDVDYDIEVDFDPLKEYSWETWHTSIGLPRAVLVSMIRDLLPQN